MVTDFDVTSVSEPRSEPLKVIELSKAFAEAEAANKAFNEKKKTYQDANIEALNRVIKAQGTAPLSGRDGQVQAEWEKWQAETGAEAKKLSAARAAFSESRPVANLSLTTGNAAPPAAIEEMNGNLVSRDVNVAATVRGPDSATSQKNYVVTLSRAVIKGKNGDRTGKWIVTNVKPA